MKKACAKMFMVTLFKVLPKENNQNNHYQDSGQTKTVV